MGPVIRIVVLIAVALGVFGALVLKAGHRSSDPTPIPGAAPVFPAGPGEEPVPASYEPSAPGIPRLVSLGAGACVPCRAMAPIRVELRREYAGTLAVDFYDVWKDRSAGPHFHVRAIPTLIFCDASGRELARREGFMAKEEILMTFRSLGIDLQPVAGG